MSLKRLKVICRSDPTFLYTVVSSAHRVCMPLFQLIKMIYIHDYHEEPASIQYRLVGIETREDFNDRIWIHYKGQILRDGKKAIPFEATMSYNPFAPKLFCETLFINARREVPL